MHVTAIINASLPKGCSSLLPPNCTLTSTPKEKYVCLPKLKHIADFHRHKELWGGVPCAGLVSKGREPSRAANCTVRCSRASARALPKSQDEKGQDPIIKVSLLMFETAQVQDVKKEVPQTQKPSEFGSLRVVELRVTQGLVGKKVEDSGMQSSMPEVALWGLRSSAPSYVACTTYSPGRCIDYATLSGRIWGFPKIGDPNRVP